jgi:acyl carrier protein
VAPDSQTSAPKASISTQNPVDWLHVRVVVSPGALFGCRTRARVTYGALLVTNQTDMSSELKQQIKELLVSELNLAGKDPAAIADDAPLFGGGLNLDSLDALQIAMFIEERFGVTVPDSPEARPIFASVNALAEFVESARTAKVAE